MQTETKARFYANGRQAKVGDAVICVDDRFSFNRLVLGGKHTVEASYAGTPVVIVHNAYHCAERFVLAEVNS